MSNKITTEVGKFLVKLRIDFDETMVEMGKRLHITHSMISKVQKGQKRIPLEWIKKINNAYPLNNEQKKDFERALIADFQKEITNTLRISSALLDVQGGKTS